MKNIFFILAFLFVSSSAFGQKYFKNPSGGDNKWSNGANWTNGKPTAQNAKVVIKAGNPILDVNVTLGQIKLAADAANDVTITAESGKTLTFSGKNTTELLVNGHTGKKLTMDLPMVVSSSDNENIKIYNANAGSGTSANITFGSSSTFTVSNDVDITFIVNSDGKGTKSVSLDGAITSGGKLIIGTKSKITFGSTYDGSGHTGGMLLNGENTTLTVNSADDSTFLKADSSITTGDNSTGHKIIIDGKNVYKGNIITKNNPLTLTVKKNQSAIGTIAMGSGNLNLALADAVTSVKFAVNKDSDWGTGNVVITGAADNEVAFGTDNTAITTEQLAQITISGGEAAINSSGQISANQIVVSTFNNAGGDKLWSNAANWTAGIPTVDTAKITVTADLIVDSSKTIAQITSTDSSTITATDSSTLTITGVGVTQPIRNNKASTDLIFNLPVVFDSSEDAVESVRFLRGSSNINFLSTLTLNDDLTVSGAFKTHALNLNGSLLGTGKLKLGAKAQAVFGADYDGTTYNADIVVIGTGATNSNQVSIVSNVKDNGTFLAAGNVIDVQSTGAQISINGVNTLKGNIKVGDNNPTLTINKNQSAIGTVTIGSGTLNLALVNAVTSAVFVVNKDADWGTGKVVITGALDDVVAFGTDATGITADQLAQITIAGTTAVINDSGQISAFAILASTFTNAGGDKLWSNAANWSDGIPTVDTAKVTITADSLIVDSNRTVAKIQNKGTTSAGSITVIATNSSTLTVTGDGNITQPIQNNKKSGSLIFNLPVIFDTTEDATKTFRFNSGGDQSITFSSTLTLNDDLTVSGANKLHALNLNGSLLGTGKLIFGSKAQVSFGADYDGTTYTADIIAAGGTTGNNQVAIVSNVKDDGTFLASGSVIDVQSTGVKISVNGANTMKGNINIGNNNPTLTINKNQDAIGTITMGSGTDPDPTPTLNLVLDGTVTSAVFVVNKDADWGTGKVIITGAADNEVGFGTDATGITADQLAQITIAGGEAVINDSGKISALEVKESTFNNTSGDYLWSTYANWSAGIPNVNTAKVILKDTLIFDKNVELAQIKVASGIGNVAVTATNGSILTLNGSGVGQPIQNNGANANLKLDLPIVLSSTEIETIQANGGGTCSITFGKNSDLTLSGVTKFVAQNSRYINLNGILQGSGQFQVGAASTIAFKSDSNNSTFTGGFKMLGNNSSLTVDTANDGTFLNFGIAISPDTTSTGHQIIVNGANVIKGNIVMLDNPLSLTFNANQSALGTIAMGGGTLKLIIDSDTTLTFADNATSDWGTGTLALNGAGVNKVSFGSSASGITETQLSQIIMDGSSAMINSSGQLSPFSLAANNNKVQVTSATCIGNSDGSIGLSVEDAFYDYTITVTDNDNVTITGDSKTGSVTGLAAGTYTVCFTVDGNPIYEQCFDVVIGQPAALSAYLDIDNDKRTTSIQLGGSSSYNIDINGTKYDVSGDSFIATLPTGLSIIKISTDLDCQGVIEREVFLSEDILYYPNPTKGEVDVYVNGEDGGVKMSVFTTKGDLLFTRDQEILDTRKTELDLSGVPAGTYLITLEGPTVRKTFKIVKR